MSLFFIKGTITNPRRSHVLAPPPLEVLANALQVRKVRASWLAGDGSDRCYYRITADELKNPYVLMQLSDQDAIALKEHGYDWVILADLFANFQIPHPKVKAKLPDYAALIIEDYGDEMLESVVLQKLKKNQPYKLLYSECFDMLTRLLKIPYEKNAIWTKRSFDTEKYEWELLFFHKHFIDGRIELSAGEFNTFKSESKQIAEFLSSYSKYFVHRDFHSRNVMVRKNHLALIDFQDARLGSAVYDLASLVFDNYVSFTLPQRKELLEQGLQHFQKELGNKLNDEIREHLSAIILQRQLKAIGSYGYLTFAKKRGDYMKYVKPALSTLTKDLVFEDRWPFISGELIERMNHVHG